MGPPYALSSSLTYLGSTQNLGNLSPWQAYSFGRHAYGWTRVTLSYIDRFGRRVVATQRIGVDLRRRVKADGDAGQVVIEIAPTAITAERRYWVSC